MGMLTISHFRSLTKPGRNSYHSMKLGVHMHAHMRFFGQTCVKVAFKEARPRFVHLENLNLNFLSSLFVIHVNLVHTYSWRTVHTLLGALFDLEETDKRYSLHFMSNLGGRARALVIAYENSDHTVYTAWVKMFPHKRMVTV